MVEDAPSNYCQETPPLVGRVRNYTLGLLNRRDYPSGELAAKIEKKFSAVAGFTSSLAAETIGWLEELGYVDDKKYCSFYVSSSLAKGRGRLRIHQELRLKHMDSDLIDQTLSAQDMDWVATALLALQKKFKVAPDNPADKAKAIRFLQYRGFLPEEVYAALDLFASQTDDIDEA